MQHFVCFNVSELIAPSSLPDGLLHVSDELPVGRCNSWVLIVISTSRLGLPLRAKSAQIGAHSRSSKIEPSNYFVILAISAPILIQTCYFNLRSILTVDRCDRIKSVPLLGLSGPKFEHQASLTCSAIAENSLDKQKTEWNSRMQICYVKPLTRISVLFSQ